MKPAHRDRQSSAAVGSTGRVAAARHGSRALLHASLTADRKRRFQFTSKPAAPSRAARWRASAESRYCRLRCRPGADDEAELILRLVVVDTRRCNAATSGKAQRLGQPGCLRSTPLVVICARFCRKFFAGLRSPLDMRENERTTWIRAAAAIHAFSSADIPTGLRP